MESPTDLNSLLFRKSSKTPVPDAPGVFLNGRDPIRIPAKGDVWIHGCLAVEEPIWSSGHIEAWPKGLFLSAVSQRNQAPFIRPLVGDAALFEEDFQRLPLKDGSHLILLPFNFRIREALHLPAARETYYLQASCRQYRSGVFVVETT